MSSKYHNLNGYANIIREPAIAAGILLKKRVVLRPYVSAKVAAKRLPKIAPKGNADTIDALKCNTYFTKTFCYEHYFKMIKTMQNEVKYQKSVLYLEIN